MRRPARIINKNDRGPEKFFDRARGGGRCSTSVAAAPQFAIQLYIIRIYIRRRRREVGARPFYPQHIHPPPLGSLTTPTRGGNYKLSSVLNIHSYIYIYINTSYENEQCPAGPLLRYTVTAVVVYMLPIYTCILYIIIIQPLQLTLFTIVCIIKWYVSSAVLLLLLFRDS